jgi:hypothetical protein
MLDQQIPDATIRLRDEIEGAGINKVLDQLDNELVGVKPIETRIREIASLLLIERLRKKLGLTGETPTPHMSSTGDPGSGKTTVAVDILHKLGFIRRGHLVSATRDDLVGQYIGHTAPKTKEKAMGGVLFIDEPYYPCRPENERDYGQESIEILLQVWRRSERTWWRFSPDTAIGRTSPSPATRAFAPASPNVDFPDYEDHGLADIAELMLKHRTIASATRRAPHSPSPGESSIPESVGSARRYLRKLCHSESGAGAARGSIEMREDFKADGNHRKEVSDGSDAPVGHRRL